MRASNPWLSYFFASNYEKTYDFPEYMIEYYMA